MTVDKVTAVILCGGLGSRLKSVLFDIPKPMVPVGETPFIQSVVDYLKNQGIRRIILCIGFKGGVIKKHFESMGQDQDIEIVFSEEAMPLGTGGAFKNAEPKIQNYPVLVLNGDTHYSVNISELLKFHDSQKGIATIVVMEAGKRQDGGNVRVSEQGRIISFEEKSASEKANFLNAGMYIFEREAVEFIPSGASSLEKEIFPHMVARNIFAFSVDVSQFDIGTPERLDLFRNLHLTTSPK